MARTAILCVLVAGIQASSQNNAEPIQAIGSALRANQYQEAVQLAARALKVSPNDVRLLTMEAIGLSGLGNEREALAAFNQALSISPDYLAALEGAAQIEYKAGADRAIPLLDRLLKLRPDEPTAHAMRAVMAWTRRDCTTAVQHFAQSKTAIASQAPALREYGICLTRLKQTEEAISVFQQLVALEPGDRQARLSLGALELMAGRNREVIDTAQPLLGPGPEDADALDLAAAAHEALDDTPTAVSLLQRAIVSAPSNEKLYTHFASLCLVHNSFQVGIDMMDAGITRIPNASQLYLARGVLNVQLGHYDKADADFATAERLDPKQMHSTGARVLAQYQAGDFEKALASVRSQLKSRPKDEFLYYLLAEILMARGAEPGTAEFSEAERAAAHAVELKPDYALARDLLSRLYLQSKKLDRAIEQCRLALRDNPSDPIALYRLIRALRTAGGAEAANELPDLLKRFEEVRRQAQKQEADEHRYLLVEQSAAQAAPVTGKP